MALRVLIAILILAVPVEITACGPFLPVSLFTIPLRPVSPGDFAHGQLGVLQPTYERFYQVMAYRYLSGIGLNDQERAEVFRTHPDPTQPQPPAPADTGNPWLAARNKLFGVQQQQYINRDRMITDPGKFEIFENCHDDAFRTAAATLARIEKLDNAGPAITDWVAAQDTVFSNCAPNAWNKPPEPAIPKPAADPRLRADRDYQIAAAKFYSRQYDAARQDFQTIAQDQSSPWRGLAPYLAARCLIRAEKLDDAEAELRRIAADPAPAARRADVERLLDFVESHLHPEQRMHEAALAVVRRDSQTTIERDLTDYRFLFDKDTNPQPADDLTDWIHSFQAGGAGALEKWRAAHTLPWLIAALQAAQPADQAAPDLLAAARAIPPDSPAYLTASYHMVRLLRANDARAKAEEMLAATIPADARNLFRVERRRLAQTFDDFLRYAPLRPVADLYDIVDPVKQPQDTLDDDSASILNRDVPLSLLKHAAAGNLLPDGVRQQLQGVIALRTVLFSPSPRFDDLFAELKSPGTQPFVRSGSGRWTKDLTKIDEFRDNWWCSFDGKVAGGPDIGPPNPLNQPPKPETFLSADERQQAADERARLQALPPGPDWLGAQALAFAQSHPQDPRVPEALYLVVRATRYGCSGKDTGGFSHRAFDLLHRRYPNSEWTRKTPYWFN